jgi:arylsulfatase A-like enzyme
MDELIGQQNGGFMSRLTRRDLLAAASLGPAALGAAASSMQSKNRPNVILIVGDDLGYGDLGCYGQKLIQTPHLDALAAEGLRFQQAYSGSTVCAPSRCCLMTGKHTGHATVRGNENPHVPLRADELTIAEVFKKAGYRTGAFGKWGLGTPPDMHALPTRKGFDRFYGYLHQVHAHTYFPDMLWDNEREAYLAPNFGGKKKLYSHDLISQRLLNFIEENRSNPFFLYAPFTLPHGNFEVPDDAPYGDRDWPPVVKNIASMVTRLDASVGAIVDRIKRYNLSENTLVLFSSDNGPGGVARKAFNSSGPFRGIKRDMYEGGIRVPLIARWPGRIKPGVTDQVCASWDLLPTAADLLDAPAPSGVDGISFLPTLLGQPSKQKQHDFLYWEFYERGFQQAVRMGDWKAVRLKPGTPLELYDLAKDPGEKQNIATDNTGVVSKIEDILTKCRTKSEKWG